MYVLADLEWVDNDQEKISFSQIALMRVDAEWNKTGSFYSRFRPKDYSFQLWNHVGYTGGTPHEFMNAPISQEVFEQVKQWLKHDDIILWWYGNAKQWVQKLIPTITNQQIVLSKYMPQYLGEDGQGNAYRVGGTLGLDMQKT